MVGKFGGVFVGLIMVLDEVIVVLGVEVVGVMEVFYKILVDYCKICK